MKRWIAFGLGIVALWLALNRGTGAGTGLFIAYPPNGHSTTSDRIFLIGTAPLGGKVLVNGRPIGRSEFGHFAPSVPLQLGKNQFTVSYGNQSIKLTIERISNVIKPPDQLGLVEDSLYPQLNVIKPIGELVCFRAVATLNSIVTASNGDFTMELSPEDGTKMLPPNSAVLTDTAQIVTDRAGVYGGCTRSAISGKYIYKITKNGETKQAQSKGSLTIREKFPTIVVTTDQAITRSGAGTDFSRLTPLPKGTQSIVTGQEGNWLRLEYGAWIEQKDTKPIDRATPPRSKIRGISSRNLPDKTEILFPLEVPIPISIKQEEQKLILTLHHVTAQTDTIFLVQNPVIDRLDFQQTLPDRVEYTLTMKTKQQWGYTTRYENNTLVLVVRHPPVKPKVLIDPGHGSKNDLGARGPNGYLEKDVTLIVSQLLAKELRKKDIDVILTRTGDEDLFPQQRADMINRNQPTIALSIHYNALPDNGNAEQTEGIGVFWYHPQSHRLAQFLHDRLTSLLQRKSYGIFWNNLALTRPTTAPAVLLELGFMIHPREFAWIVDPQAQQKLAKTLAQSLQEWFENQAS